MFEDRGVIPKCFNGLHIKTISLLHRPFFIKFSLLTTKQIIFPATSTREKRAFFSWASRFSDWGGSRIGAVLVLYGQMS